MVLRHRLKKVVSLKTVKVLDAFPKVNEACYEISPIGGTASVISYILIAWFTLCQTSEYFHSEIVYKFLPDTKFDEKFNLFMDITVAMPCNLLGVDISDSTNQNKNKFGELAGKDTWFELEPAQRKNFKNMKLVNSHIREHYHKVHQFLWKSQFPSFIRQYLPRKTRPKRAPDACRIYGALTLNKVVGYFHISLSKAVKLPEGHVNITDLAPQQEYNFSHRINQFGFGVRMNGIVNPLEGDEKIAPQNMMLYQYFIDIVPTEVDILLLKHSTYQYSAKELARPIDHNAESHRTPGIFFKYDISPFKVKVMQKTDSFSKFAIKLCASMGGIHVITGVITTLIKNLVKLYEKNKPRW